MSSSRLEVFSHGVIAIIITNMVLDLKLPENARLDASSGRSSPPMKTFENELSSCRLTGKRFLAMQKHLPRLDSEAIPFRLPAFLWRGV